MSTFQIDRSLSSDGVYQYTTDNGVRYIVKISETAPGSGLATMDFILLAGSPSAIEIFRTMGTLYELAFEHVESKNYKNILVYITGSNREEIDQKTRIFTRWVNPEFWDHQIVPNPQIIIPGKRNGTYMLPTNAIVMTRKNTTVSVPAPAPSVDIKFCYNCGEENNNYKFCPKCGTNLQGA